MNTKTILIAEDDETTASLVSAYLEREGFPTIVAPDGEACLREFRASTPILVILDIMLPGIDGWEICRILRKTSDVPILMLTARIEEIDRVKGLAMGADDYVVKPFSTRELVERVKAILRRARTTAPQPQPEVLTCGSLELNTIKRTVTLKGRDIPLTSFEFKLLHVLMGSSGRAFSREDLINLCHQDEIEVIDRVIDVHVSKLRQKIEDDPAAPRYIITLRGYGYRFNDGCDS